MGRSQRPAGTHFPRKEFQGSRLAAFPTHTHFQGSPTGLWGQGSSQEGSLGSGERHWSPTEVRLTPSSELPHGEGTLNRGRLVAEVLANLPKCPTRGLSERGTAGP